ncbi:acyltransferase [Kitasatospora sp. MMS16-BH015]|uniref:acyltransferase family protein n=1 Tax=Kitasatospora sp. MMS16-BH015 TaxID=2018025 RepID=UPI000CA2935A|nr:acyltransferase [Kitasatospora sp. MMS16-BH015]AUG78673.1 acyltransferase [Kitasatospora sp. MMS16-BH015]
MPETTVRPRTGRLRTAAHRIDAATAPERDRALDALRALAILGVVLGHWLVTALVVDTGTLQVASPLHYLPELAPVSWAFQTLAVFFLVGGLVAARSLRTARTRGTPYRHWLTARLARLFRPVAVLLTVWAVAGAALLAGGVSPETVHTLVKLAVSPLWFLLVFAALTAATPLLARLHPAWPLALVTLVDLARFQLGAPEQLGYLNELAGWSVPYCLGAAWAGGRGRQAAHPGDRRADRRTDRRTAWALLLGGAAATAALIRWGGYPAAMVGVPGAAVSNLGPLTLAAVTFGLAQCGAALLLLGPLRRAMRRPAAWAAVALVNLFAMTVFLWHQTAMMAVSALGLLTDGTAADGPLPGLHTLPDGPGWILTRLLWLPLFALALLACWAAFHTHERPSPTRKSDPAPHPEAVKWILTNGGIR